ncbi:MAG: hypothetical protein GY729_02095 [Desulfobacteraceae bacterium]|nr:hypothetical protein [Desulfobacteraceae bacterium]
MLIQKEDIIRKIILRAVVSAFFALKDRDATVRAQFKFYQQKRNYVLI